MKRIQNPNGRIFAKMGSEIINSTIHRKLSKMRVLLVIDANSLNTIAKNILLKDAHTDIARGIL